MEQTTRHNRQVSLLSIYSTHFNSDYGLVGRGNYGTVDNSAAPNTSQNMFSGLGGASSFGAGNPGQSNNIRNGNQNDLTDVEMPKSFPGRGKKIG